MKPLITKTRDMATRVASRLKKLTLSTMKRSVAANILMVGFIIFTSIGAGLQSPALGFISAGLTCGIFGFLLGND